jgi:hypothetical protein
MKNIIYLSTAVKLITDEQLIDILNSARTNNKLKNVTGVLLYGDGTFIQVIEGEDADVDYIFDKILKDTRHKNVITLMNAQIVERSFDDWVMGFASVDAAQTENLTGYLQNADKIMQTTTKASLLAY